jgi:hypothetical protein
MLSYNIQRDAILKALKIEEKSLLEKVRKSIATGDYVILPHARIRCTEREVSAADIEHALEIGRRIKMRDRFDEALKRWSYAYEGSSIDGESLRVIVTFIEKLAVVTVVKLGVTK